MPLDPDPEPIGDLGSTEYVLVKRRADNQWGVAQRGGNHQSIFTNNEGWTELAYALERARRSFPHLPIYLITAPGTAPTVIRPEDELP